MSCIKTGADVYFLAHGFLARTDVYQIGDCYIFRYTTGCVEYCLMDSIDRKAWIVDDRFDSTWFREDLGVVVAPNSDILNHGERC